MGRGTLTKNDAMAALGRELRARRKAAGKTIQQFSFELGISDRQLRRYERGRCFPPDFRLKRIAQLLELESSFFLRFFRETPRLSGLPNPTMAPSRLPQRVGEQVYRAGSFAELIEAGYSENWLLAEAVRLERTFPADEIIDGFKGSNEMGTVEKWNALTSANAETAFGVVRNDQMIAYWFCLPVKQNTYERAVSGENVNAEIELNDIAFFDFPQDYDFYFVDLYQSSDAPPWVVNKLLLDGFLNLLKSLAENGHFVRRMCTHAYAVETERICEKSGFTYVCDHKHHARLDDRPDRMRHTKMYEISFSTDTLPSLIRYDEDLERLYEDRFHFRAQRRDRRSATQPYRPVRASSISPQHSQSY